MPATKDGGYILDDSQFDKMEGEYKKGAEEAREEAEKEGGEEVK